MALPVYRAVGAKCVGTTGAVTVTAPAGLATGDLEILIATTIETGTLAITNNGGGAWTALAGTPVSLAGAGILYAWQRKRLVTDSDPIVDPTLDFSCSARIAITTGTFDATTPIEISSVGTGINGTGVSFAPGTSTAAIDRLCFVVGTSGVDSNTGQAVAGTIANAALSAVSTTALANYQTASGAGGGFWISKGAKATAGSIGTWTASLTSPTTKVYLSFAVRPVPGTVFTKTVTGSLSFSAAPLKRTVGHRMAGSMTPTGAVTKSFKARTVTGTFTPSGALSRSLAVSKQLTGSFHPTGVLHSQLARTLSGSLMPTSGTVAFVKSTTHILTGGLTFSGALTPRSAKNLSASFTPTGALSRTISVSKQLTASFTPTGALSKATSKTLAGASAFFSGLLAHDVPAAALFTASFTPTGAVSHSLPNKTLTATLDFDGVLSRLTNKRLRATFTPSGILHTLFNGQPPSPEPPASGGAGVWFHDPFRGMFRVKRPKGQR